jgi:hypothetical protein
VVAHTVTSVDSGRETVAVNVIAVVPRSPSVTETSPIDSEARDRNRATCGS